MILGGLEVTSAFRTKPLLLHKLLELGYGKHVGILSLQACRYCHGYILEIGNSYVLYTFVSLSF